MKNANLIFCVLALLSQAGSALAASASFLQAGQMHIAELADMPDDAVRSDEGQALQAADSPAALTKHTDGTISYISGGIGQDEVEAMKQMAKDYPLEIVCVQKTMAGEIYLASVIVRISDRQGKVWLDTTTDGPIVLADLPKGRYQISAEYNNSVRTNHVNLGNKHQRVVFLWPDDAVE